MGGLHTVNFKHEELLIDLRRTPTPEKKPDGVFQQISDNQEDDK
jgi:hypothetical protein